MKVFRNIGYTLLGKLWDLLSLPLYIPLYTLAVMNKKIMRFLAHKRKVGALKREIGKPEGKVAWFYCASMGELDRALPLAQALRAKGYSPLFFCHAIAGIHYAQVHGIAQVHLNPFDFHWNWRRLIWHCKPALIVVEKHEFWPGFLSAVTAAGLHRVLINAANLEELTGFKRMAYRAAQAHFDQVFMVSGHASGPHLYSSGDTRLDRMRMQGVHVREEIEKMGGNPRLHGMKRMVLGNAYPKDALLLAETLRKFPELHAEWEFMVLPNRPHMAQAVLSALPGSIDASPYITIPAGKVAVVASAGYQFLCYAIAHAAWIGGGFDQGIHNTLEPAFWGLPMAAGPNLDGQNDALAFRQSGHLALLQKPQDVFDWLNAPHTSRPALPDTHPTDYILQHLRLP